MSAGLHVQSLTFYPVKSCAGIALDSLTLDADGPVLDRRWMIALSEGGPPRFLSQREEPRLALIQPALSGDALRLQAPGASPLDVALAGAGAPAEPVVIWGDTVLAEPVPAAAPWLEAWLGYAARLYRLPEGGGRAVNPEYARAPATTTFTDGYPVLLIGRASLDALNARLAQRGVPALEMRRFRPNIVVSGSTPFAEDDWRRIAIGGLPFDVVKPCPRCAITTVDPARGVVVDAREPLATLADFRRTPQGKVMFGQNLIHRAVGTVCVGDSVVVRESAPA